MQTKKPRRRFRFLPPRSIGQNSAGDRFDREEPKGGKGSSVILYGDPETPTRFGRVWYFVDLDTENQMPDEAPSPTLDRELTTNIVASYVRRNQNRGRPTAGLDLDCSLGARRPRQTGSRNGS